MKIFMVLVAACLSQGFATLAEAEETATFRGNQCESVLQEVEHLTGVRPGGSEGVYIACSQQLDNPEVGSCEVRMDYEYEGRRLSPQSAQILMKESTDLDTPGHTQNGQVFWIFWLTGGDNGEQGPQAFCALDGIMRN